ncbi:class I SAM-dependent methyltransferase [Arsenicicoccus dermatophilus]|uniref:class I SAM-dependent methyltransferase n=1 Tax=Arsenicicoccus dermatophilus TaxID=1076331 RepID=UPI00391726E5
MTGADRPIDEGWAGREAWLDRAGSLRQVVRQELVRRQLEVHLPVAPAAVLDVGAGQGTQTLHLARAGYQVVAVEPEEQMRMACAAALAAEDEQVRSRVTLVAGSIGELDRLPELADRTFEVVLCHGLLRYLDDPNQPMRALGRRVAVDGIVSVVTANAAALAWRHALRGDHDRATALLDETARAGWEGRDPRYVNELGVACRADSVERLGAYLGGIRCSLEYWYGIRTLVDGRPSDEPVPADPAELEQVIALEERLGRTEPYRRLGSLLHLVGRRGAGRGPQL